MTPNAIVSLISCRKLWLVALALLTAWGIAFGQTGAGAPDPIEGKGPGSAIHMVYDAQRRQVVLLTASAKSGLEELWGWDGKRWQLIPGVGPAARELSGAAYDTLRKRLILYGGMGLNPAEERRGDTWEWDGKSWRQIPDTSAGTRDHHSLAFDEAHGNTVLFGGAQSDRSAPTDTWVWAGVKWTRITTPGPSARHHFPMVYDSKRKQVVLFGGLGQDFKAYNDTWDWNGKTWRKHSEEGPPGRTHHSMAFDSQTGVIVLFGGLKTGRITDALDDTWIWDGEQWKEMKVVGPAKRSMHVMAYDAARGKTVLYGGSFFDGRVSTRYHDTWEWNGQQWLQVVQ